MGVVVPFMRPLAKAQSELYRDRTKFERDLENDAIAVSKTVGGKAVEIRLTRDEALRLLQCLKLLEEP